MTDPRMAATIGKATNIAAWAIPGARCDGSLCTCDKDLLERAVRIGDTERALIIVTVTASEAGQ